MPISDSRKVDFVWKKIKGRIFTDNFPSSSGKTFYEEFPGTLVNPHASEVWIEEIPIPAPGTSTDVVQYYSDLTLTEDNSVVNHRSWLACETVGDPTTRLKGWIPPRFHQSYTVRIYDNSGTEITTTHDSLWFFDYENGVLVFEEDPSTFGLSLPIHLRGYRYTGKNVLDGLESVGIRKYRWYLTENDYRTHNGNSHIIFLRRDILRDSSKLKVYIDGVEHSYVFFNQRQYKDGSNLGNYYTQHINVNDYPIGSESGRDIYVEYTELYTTYPDFTIRLTRSDGQQIFSKNIPKTMQDENFGPRYLSDLLDISDDHTYCNLEYTSFYDPTTTTTHIRRYPTHVYCPQFPKNYDFFNNDGLILEVWACKPRTKRGLGTTDSIESGTHMLLIDCATSNLYDLSSLSPGMYKFRFLDTNTNTVSKFFGTIKKYKIPIFTTDATVSKKDFKGFVYRTLAF